MKKIVFICPYIGTLPKNQMKLFLKSCEMNPNVDWILMTNDEYKYNYPKNVKVIYTTLEQLKRNFQEKFDFPISLDFPYKLCDFRPAYGYVFQNIIKEYDYWGHCDLSDSIFGNFENTICAELEKGYDKIGLFGHLTLYRNTKQVNERIFIPSKTGRNLKDIFGEKENMAFDDTGIYNMNYLYWDNELDIKRIDELYVDISTRSSCFKRALWSDRLKWLYLLKERYVFEWDNGSLYKIYLKDNEIKKEEILYVHYQKREMEYEINLDDIKHYFIVPNKFIELESLTKKDLLKYTRRTLINKTLLKIRINKLKKKMKGK